MNVLCRCGKPTPLKVAWTTANPGRRFFGCSLYPKANSCRFFQWYEPPFPEQANIVISGLLKKTNKLSERERMLKFLAKVSTIFQFTFESGFVHVQIDKQLFDSM
ncbi:hypothetical protein A4A49_52952 [Nicotiana attenuata]|uniref:GRF-type domain-containing protein n=1 Tax=Nicotiana attenuata TaxID=49451 RepID=A0A1J6J891_NICAT|nr:hypothetical protein A4A49_52952 [Nicotiana attenuata]